MGNKRLENFCGARDLGSQLLVLPVNNIYATGK
jgi:hypothetical protein